MAAAGGAGNLSEWIRDTLDREAESVERVDFTLADALVRFVSDDRFDFDSAVALMEARALENINEEKTVEEGPDGKALGETPDEATAQVAPEGSSSTDVIQVDPDHNPDYVIGPHDEVPRLMTPEESEMFGIVKEEPVGTSGDAEPDPPLPGEPDGSSSTVEDLDVIRTVGDAERALNDLIEVPPKTVMVEQRVPNPYPEGFTPTVEFERPDVDLFDDNDALANPVKLTAEQIEAAARPDKPSVFEVSTVNATNEELGIVSFTPHDFKSSEPVAPTGGALTPSGERDVSSPGPDPGSDVSTDTHKAARFYNDPDDDTNPEPEDPVDLEPPRMLEADTPARATLSPVCVNAAMHWKLVAGETCRYCGGTL